jgi:negative regulator of flagellin synthesis FlgM
MSSKINGLPPVGSTPDVPAVSARKTEAARKDPIAPEADSLELTPSARVLGEGAADAPVDSPRVERLRQSIADGSYRIDADRIAGKLLDIERSGRKD